MYNHLKILLHFVPIHEGLNIICYWGGGGEKIITKM